MDMLEHPVGERLIEYVIDPVELFYSTASSCLKAIEFCRRIGIKHGDIKPANILFNKHGQLKLSDFGETSNIEENTCATPLYWSPAIFKRRNPSDLRVGSSDLWSLGIISLEIFYGKNPVMYYNNLLDLNDIIKLEEALLNLDKYRLLYPFSTKTSLDKEIMEFIQRCLSNFGTSDELDVFNDLNYRIIQIEEQLIWSQQTSNLLLNPDDSIKLQEALLNFRMREKSIDCLQQIGNLCIDFSKVKFQCYFLINESFSNKQGDIFKCLIWAVATQTPKYGVVLVIF